MIASGAVATDLQLRHPEWPYSTKLLTTIGISTVVWVTVTYLTRPVEERRLVSFLKKIRPGSPGWAKVRRRYGIAPQPFFRRGLLCWILGLIGLFGLNFGVGGLLLGKSPVAVILLLLEAGLALALLGRAVTGTRREPSS